MKFLHKYGTRDVEIARAKKELSLYGALVLVVVVFFIAMILISKMHPRLEEGEESSTDSTVQAPFSETSILQSRTRIQSVARNVQFKQSSGSLEKSDLAALKEAIDLQNSLIQMRESEIVSRTDLNQLEELLRLYDQAMGAKLSEQSKQMEEQARQLLEVDFNKAIETLEAAIALQAEINRDYSRSEMRSPQRIHTLEGLKIEWLTRPLYDSISTLRKESNRAVEKGDFQKARSLIDEALQTQIRLNREFRDSRYASLIQLREIEAEWEALQIAEDLAKVENLLIISSTALDAGNGELSRAKAAEAETLLRKIAETNPTSGASLETFLTQARTLQDTASSKEAFNKWLELREAVYQSLRTEDFSTLQSALPDWYRHTQDFIARYEKSDFRKQIDLPHLEYLHGLRRELRALVTTLNSNLLPVPGDTTVLLYRTEIPQRLFERIMGNNPSLNKGPDLPVDSISWEEAQEFTRRASWILAKSVKLPTRSSYLRAVGDISQKDLDQITWHSQNTSRKARPVGQSRPNASGFYDLLGNVAEWTASTDNSSENAIAIGGSLRDTIDRLAEIPQESRNKQERNRFVGFRISTPNE